MLHVENVSPELAALVARSSQLAERRQACAERRLELVRARQAVDTSFEDRVDALVHDADVMPPAKEARDYDREIAAVDVEARALGKARDQVREQIKKARRAASREVATELRPEHRAAIAQIIQGVELMFEGLRAQQATFARLRAAGADAGALPNFQLDPRTVSVLNGWCQEARAYAYVGQ
jgi:hypothetical protein